ncbi:MAG: tetratricopeptide repeat protein [Bacteroidaceae bacterium]|nr:tetratricopeptide repeat protein [Bacteroidaceae bacterium]
MTPLLTTLRRYQRRLGLSLRQRVVAFLCLTGTIAACPQVNTDNVVLMGRAALSLSDNLTAIRYFSQAIESKPYLAAAWYYRAYAKFQLDDYEGALADCNESIRLNPYIVEVYQLRGLCHIRTDSTARAIGDYDRVLSELPNDQNALYNRAICHLELKNYDEADKGIDQVLHRWRNYRNAYLVKAQINLERNDTLKAVAWMDSLLQLNLREPQAWSFKGSYALAHQNYADADSFFTRAISYQPERYEPYMGRAQARNAVSRFGDAISDYDAVINMVPEHFVAHYNRGLLRALVGDNNRAISDFDFVLKQEPDNTLALYNRAQLREETGNLRGAIADYTRLLKEYPHFTYGYAARARLRRKVGDNRGALTDETIVARSNLDLAFGQKRRRPVKEVRRRSDHELENYQQLMEDDSDTVRFIGGDMYGKVQNLPAERKPLPQFALSLHIVPAKGYHSVAYLPEVDAINRHHHISRPMQLTAEPLLSEQPLPESDIVLLANDSPTRNVDTLLLRSAYEFDRYNLTAALRWAEAAVGADSLNMLAYMQRAAVLTSLHSTTTLALQESDAPRMAYIALALSDLEQAAKLQPGCVLIYYNKACLLAATGRNEAALEALNTAIGMDNRMAEAYYNRALLHMQAQRTAEAAADFSQAGALGLYKAYNLLKQLRSEK